MFGGLVPVVINSFTVNSKYIYSDWVDVLSSLDVDGYFFLGEVGDPLIYPGFASLLKGIAANGKCWAAETMLFGFQEYRNIVSETLVGGGLIQKSCRGMYLRYVSPSTAINELEIPVATGMKPWLKRAVQLHNIGFPVRAYTEANIDRASISERLQNNNFEIVKVKPWDHWRKFSTGREGKYNCEGEAFCIGPDMHVYPCFIAAISNPGWKRPKIITSGAYSGDHVSELEEIGHSGKQGCTLKSCPLVDEYGMFAVLSADRE